MCMGVRTFAESEKRRRRNGNVGKTSFDFGQETGGKPGESSNLSDGYGAAVAGSAEIFAKLSPTRLHGRSGRGYAPGRFGLTGLLALVDFGCEERPDNSS